MTPEEKAIQLLNLFDGNKDHAIACCQEIINSDPHGIDWWKQVLELLKIK